MYNKELKTITFTENLLENTLERVKMHGTISLVLKDDDNNFVKVENIVFKTDEDN